MTPLLFQDVTLQDRAVIQQYTIPADRQHCDISFSNLLSWFHVCGTQWTVCHDTLLLRYRIRGHLRYMMPVGIHPELALHALIHDARQFNEPYFIQGITSDDLPLLNGLKLPEARSNRDDAEYIYLREALAGLHGKHLQAKRNFCNRFRALHPDWRYEHLEGVISAEQLSSCLALEEVWYHENENEHPHLGQSIERQAVIYALHHFNALQLTAGLLYAGGQLAAFTFGTIINHNTFGVHAEKALTQFEGAYAAINQCFASHLPESFTYLNREEDMGIPGLRQAKLSYHPCLLLDKYSVSCPAGFVPGKA